MLTWIGRLPLLPISAAGFQSLITRYAWGTIWIRPVLDQKTRSRLGFEPQRQPLESGRLSGRYTKKSTKRDLR